MALTTLPHLKLMLGIPTSDTTEDALLTLLITQTSALIERSCMRIFNQAIYEEFYNGNNQPFFELNQRPVVISTQNGTLTAGSPTVTGLTTTTGLIAGMPVNSTILPAGTGIPANTTILTVASPTSVTLSKNATTNGTYYLVFGIQLFLDRKSLWGIPQTAFADETLKIPGLEYALEIDGRDPTSRLPWSNSGNVYNQNGYWPQLFDYRAGRISPGLGAGNGNIKVIYAGGFPTIPDDVELACNLMIAKVRNTTAFGEALTSESDEGFSYSLAGASTMGLFTQEVNSILARYRNIAVA